MKKLALLLPTFCLAAVSMSANADTPTMVSPNDHFTTDTHSTNFKYEEETYILSQRISSNNQDVQDALWAIFNSNDHLTNGSTAANLVKHESSFNYTTAFLSGYDFYILVNPGGHNDPSDRDGNGIPQEFIGLQLRLQSLPHWLYSDWV